MLVLDILDAEQVTEADAHSYGTSRRHQGYNDEVDAPVICDMRRLREDDRRKQGMRTRTRRWHMSWVTQTSKYQSCFKPISRIKTSLLKPACRQMSSLGHSSHGLICCRSVCTLGTHPMHPTATVRVMPQKRHSPVVCLSHNGAAVRSPGFQGDAKSGRLLVEQRVLLPCSPFVRPPEAWPSRPLDARSGGASTSRPWPCSGLGTKRSMQWGSGSKQAIEM